MRQKKYALRPRNLWMSGVIQQWLEEEAARGWRMTDCNGWYVTFKQAEPAQCRVRLQPQEPEARETRRERGGFYREMGWSFGAVIPDGSSDYEVWYCDDPAAPELQTDPVAQGWAWEKSLRRGWITGWIWLLGVPAVWLGVFCLMSGSLLEMFLRAEPALLLVQLLLVPLFEIWQAWTLWGIRQARRQIRAGLAPAARGNWRKHRWLWLVWPLLFVLYWTAIHTGNMVKLFPETDPPVIQTRIVAPEAEVGDWDLDTYSWRSTPLRPEHYILGQRWPDGARMEQTYDRLRFTALSGLVYREKLENFQKDGLTGNAVSDERFDEARLLTDGGTQVFLARRGTVVYSMTVTFPADLNAHLDDFAVQMMAGREEGRA